MRQTAIVSPRLRRKSGRSPPVLLLACLAATVISGARASSDLETSLPRSYAGTFQWDGDDVEQKVAIKLVTVERPAPTRVEARGCGRYEVAGRVTSIGIRLRIEVPSLNIEIWELDPVGRTAESFTVDGSHRGRLSADLQRIDAEWTTISTGRKGSLHLHATAETSCADETAAS